jgi:methionyl-tRNA formyltransferase
MANQRLVFFGNERLATGVTTTAPTLQALLTAGYDIAAVVVAQKSETKSSRQPRPLEVAQTAEHHGIPVLSPPKLSQAKDELLAFGAEAGVLAAFGKIVPKDIIDIFPKGIVNIHPSLLPRHRGSTPIETVILRGETETGVSLMGLVSKMDAGPIYAQQIVPLRGDETKQTLTDQLSQLGSNMLITHLPKILDGSLSPQAQDESNATYTEQISKANSELDFTKPAVALAREVRAYTGWPRSRAKLGTTEVIITSAHPNNDVSGTPGKLFLADKQLGVHCAEGTLLIDSLVPAGKKEMTAAGFLAGYKLQ